MKITNTRLILSLAASLALIPAAHGQAVYAAKQYSRIQAGAGGMYLDNDYTNRSAKGVAAWADADFFHYKSLLIGAEIEVHFGGIITPDDIGENSYLVGPRISYPKGKWNVYGKLLLGRATITNQELNLSSSYNVVPAFGGGVEYHIKPKWNIRLADIELQQWPNFEPNTLSPISVVVGVSYVIR